MGTPKLATTMLTVSLYLTVIGFFNSAHLLYPWPTTSQISESSHIWIKHRREIFCFAALGDGILELRAAEGVQVKFL